jgi:hypothetical protein
VHCLPLRPSRTLTIVKQSLKSDRFGHFAGLTACTQLSRYGDLKAQLERADIPKELVCAGTNK